MAKAGDYAFTLSRWPDDSRLRLTDGIDETQVTGGVLNQRPAWPVASARLRVGDVEQRAEVNVDALSIRCEVPLPAGRTTLQRWFDDASGKAISGAYYVNVKRLKTTPAVKLICQLTVSSVRTAKVAQVSPTECRFTSPNSSVVSLTEVDCKVTLMTQDGSSLRTNVLGVIASGEPRSASPVAPSCTPMNWTFAFCQVNPN